MTNQRANTTHIAEQDAKSLRVKLGAFVGSLSEGERGAFAALLQARGAGSVEGGDTQGYFSIKLSPLIDDVERWFNTDLNGDGIIGTR